MPYTTTPIRKAHYATLERGLQRARIGQHFRGIPRGPFLDEHPRATLVSPLCCKPTRKVGVHSQVQASWGLLRR